MQQPCLRLLLLSNALSIRIVPLLLQMEAVVVAFKMFALRLPVDIRLFNSLWLGVVTVV
jgi:hypothetical protein